MGSKFYSEFLKSKVGEKILLANHLFFKFSFFEKIIFFFLFLISIFCFFFFGEKKFLGFSSIFLSLFLISLIKSLFLEKELKVLKRKDGKFWWLGFEVGEAILRAGKFSKLGFLNSSLFLYFLLNEKNPKIRFIFNRLLIPIAELRQKLLSDKTPDDLERVFLELSKNGQTKIKLSELLFYLAKENKIFSDFLIQQSLKPEEVKEVAEWAEFLENEILENKKFWKLKNLVKIGSLGRDWVAGYTILLDQFSFDLLKMVKSEKFKIIFAHQPELKKVEKILISPEKNDVLIIGEPGSGRRSIVEALARATALGESFPELNFKRVVYLDLQKLISVTKNLDEFENLLSKIFEEVIFAENVILVIDNLHQYIGEKIRAAGKVDISAILGHYLPFKNFRVIGITDFSGYHRNLEKNFSISEYFEKVEVFEVSERETLLILEERALRLEQKYKIFFTFQALESIISLSLKYLPALPFPEKAIEVLDESAVFVAGERKKIVLPEDVAKVITQKTKIPVGKIEEEEREKLLKLEELLHLRVVDQDEALREVASALRRERAGLKMRKKPIGSFLFLGPTGVGKTETSKALAEIYFGSEERMIRLDMSEFQNPEDIPRLLGGGDEEGILVTKVRENPFSLILLDEFEKANPKILDLFLQVFDEGHLTDGWGRKVDFRNTLIIATSNAGAEIIFKAFKEKKEWEKMREELIDYVVQNKIFKPELLNRFDGVILFKPLSKENLLEIAGLMLKKIQKQLKEKQIDFLVDENLKEKIVELSFDPRFGAREIERVIQEKVENVLAEAILRKELKVGKKVKINPQNFKIEIF